MIYLDHNASTPVRPQVETAMAPCFADLYGNPSSLHSAGQRARAAIERARGQVAGLVGARLNEISFTSGGTEGDHLALIGAMLALRERGRERVRVAYSAVEHHAVHGAASVLRELGCDVEELPVTAEGRAELAQWEPILRRGVDLVSLMLANNETGVIQPVPEIAELAHEVGARVHCDAVQAAGKIPVSLAALRADYLVISAHKFGGPKGAGALIVRDGAPLKPLFRGSAQEYGRRGGTENLPGIVGLGAAAECAARELPSEPRRMLTLRDRFEAGLREAVPDLVVHGAGAPRLPNTTNASFPGLRSDHMLMALDARGIAVSAGAACASGSVEPSPVLSAMRVPRDLAVCALRFSMGRTTTPEDVERTLAAIPDAVRAAKAASTVGA